MNIGGVQASLAAVAPRPLRRRPDQTDASAGAVEMHFVGHAEKRFDVCLGEEIRSAMRAVKYADLPGASQDGAFLGRNYLGLAFLVAADAQRIAGLQHAGGVTAKTTQGKGGARTQIEGRIEAAAHGKVTAHAGTRDAAQRQDASGLYVYRLPIRDGCAIESRLHRSAAPAR